MKSLLLYVAFVMCLVNWECGNRDQSTFARLLKRLRKWSVWFFCTDNWPVYNREIFCDDLIQGKRGAVRIERNNARQRHWFARFRRKSLDRNIIVFFV